MITIKGWDVAADELLHTSDEGAKFLRVGDDVYKHLNGGTRWFCTMAAWPAARKCIE